MNFSEIGDQLRTIDEGSCRLEARQQSLAPLHIPDCRPIVLFGAGSLGQMTLAHLRRVGVQPVAMADNNQRRWGTFLDDVPILAPSEAAQRHARKGRFVVTIYNGSAARRQLEHLGCAHVAHFSELFFEYAAEFLPFCGLAPHSVVRDAWADVSAAAHLWSDDRSVTEYLAQLAWRLRLPDCHMPRHDPPAECYFPSDLFEYLDDEVLLDCGAFDGDSLRAYLGRRPEGSMPAVIALEPDPESFARLADYVGQLPSHLAARIRIEPWAVAQQRGRITFEALGSVRSGVAASGSSRVDAIALDDLDVLPTLIKMDIEGYELPALKGTTALLTRHQPVLAISLYHHASDLWTIPNFIKTLVPDYHLFLRRYAEDCWESVLYAVPASRLLPKALEPPSGSRTL